MKTLLTLSIISITCLSNAYCGSGKRDVYNYELKDGKKIVYIGQTKDLHRRALAHARDGKKFTHMRKIGSAKTLKGARTTEKKSLSRYRRTHRGFNPEYNLTNHG